MTPTFFKRRGDTVTMLVCIRHLFTKVACGYILGARQPFRSHVFYKIVCLNRAKIMNVVVQFIVWAGKWRAMLFQCAPLRIFLDAECKHVSNACIGVYFEEVLIELKILTQLFSFELIAEINGKRYISQCLKNMVFSTHEHQ